MRLALGVAVCVVLLTTASVVTWLRLNVVPPDCEDPRTIALVMQSLTQHFKLPGELSLDNIRTLAGGYVAFRFVCEAGILGVDRDALPPGSDVPGIVHYVSRLTPDHQRHQVSVGVRPILIWEYQQ